MRNFSYRSQQSGNSFTKLGHFFPIFEKGQGRPPPPPTFSYAPGGALAAYPTILLRKYGDL